MLGGELAAMVKSWTLYATTLECERDPLVPVTVTLYAPAEPVQDRVLVPAVPSVTVGGVSVQWRPVLGETELSRLTIPANPFTLVTVTVEAPAAPVFVVTLVGLNETAKSCTV